MVERKEKMNSSDDTASQQHQIIGLAQQDMSLDFKRTPHPDALWFPEAALGMIIHWGISSVHGGIDISWSMMKNTTWDLNYKRSNKISPKEYFQLANRFNPEHYNPDKWMKAAADAGIKYAFLTTRHHDGYAMWPSKYGKFGTRTHMDGRDLVKAYVEACRKHGLKVGLYYSPPDWYISKEKMSFDLNDMTTSAFGMPGEEAQEHERHIRGQLTELLTNYGKIDLIFFDGIPYGLTVEEIHDLQPGIIITRRSGEDYQSFECILPEKKPADWWEGCFIWNYHEWGYQEPHGYRPLGWMLDLLARCRTWGGNLLVNVAPQADGTMPESYYKRLSELAEWMRFGKESIYDVQPGPYPEQSNVPVTIKFNTWYLHLLPEDEDRKGTSWYEHTIIPHMTAKTYTSKVKYAVLTGVSKPKSVILLRTGEEILYSFDDNKLEIWLDELKCTFTDDVVAIIW